MKEAAQLVGVHYRQVQEWVSWYRQGETVEVLSRRHGGHSGPKRRLTVEQEAELKAKAKAGELPTIWDGVPWAKIHNVTYTYWAMHWVLGRRTVSPSRCLGCQGLVLW